MIAGTLQNCRICRIHRTSPIQQCLSLMNLIRGSLQNSTNSAIPRESGATHFRKVRCTSHPSRTYCFSSVSTLSGVISFTGTQISRSLSSSYLSFWPAMSFVARSTVILPIS
jgi:hypothetical protein